MNTTDVPQAQGPYGSTIEDLTALLEGLWYDKS